MSPPDNERYYLLVNMLWSELIPTIETLFIELPIINFVVNLQPSSPNIEMASLNKQSYQTR